jgi:hypothetical protein
MECDASEVFADLRLEVDSISLSKFCMKLRERSRQRCLASMVRVC